MNMKKLVFAFVMLLGLGLASCGGRSDANTDTVDTVEVTTDSVIEVVDTLEVDTVAVDSIL